MALLMAGVSTVVPSPFAPNARTSKMAWLPVPAGVDAALDASCADNVVAAPAAAAAMPAAVRCKNFLRVLSLFELNGSPVQMVLAPKRLFPLYNSSQHIKTQVQSLASRPDFAGSFQETSDQKSNFNPSCPIRGSAAIRSVPKVLPAVNFRKLLLQEAPVRADVPPVIAHSSKFTRLNTLKNSARNCMPTRSVNLKLFPSPMSQL